MSITVNKKLDVDSLLSNKDNKRLSSISLSSKGYDSSHSKNASLSSIPRSPSRETLQEKNVAKPFKVGVNAEPGWKSEVPTSIPCSRNDTCVGHHDPMNDSNSDAAVMSSNLALLIARDVSRRPPDLTKQREEADKERLKKILDIRYNMAVDEREAFPDQAHPTKIMRRVPKSGLRVEYYARNRKFTMAELSRMHKVIPSKVAAMAKAHGYVDGERLSSENIDFIVDALSITSDRLKSLSLVNKAFNARVSRKLQAKTQKIAREDAASAEFEEAKQRVQDIPKAYFGALLKMPTLPPAEILFVIKLVVLIIEKSSQLNTSVSFYGEHAIKILRGYLENGIDHTVSIILNETPANLPEETVAAVEAAISKEIKQSGASSLSEMHTEIRKYNANSEALFAWAGGITKLYRLRHEH